MSNDNMKRIVESTMGKRSDKEWDFCVDMLEKILKNDKKNGVKHTEYGLLELVRQCMKKIEKEIEN